MLITSPSQIKDIDYQPFQERLESWFAACHDGNVPTFDAYFAKTDPIKTHRIIANIAQDGQDITYDFVGSMLEALYGGEMSGKNLNDLYNDWFRKNARTEILACVDSKQPHYIRRGIAAVIKMGYYKLHLPLADDQTTYCITYIVPFDPDMKTRQDWEKFIKLTPWL